MLTKRIIPCLDVRDGKVVKGVQFRNHKIMGDILERAQYYAETGADELVFYDITASCQDRSVAFTWVEQVAKKIDIPFCVAGGIRDLDMAKKILYSGADKISVNSPALENPTFIEQLAKKFGSQCVVVGVDSQRSENNYIVHQYTGDETKSRSSQRKTIDWIRQIQDYGAGEIVLNCMDQDGVRQGYDVEQLKIMRQYCHVPLIASGGAGCVDDFVKVFNQTNVDGALAASVFHSNQIMISQLKQQLSNSDINVRLV